MGFWSASIYGGDTPLDELESLKDGIGVEIPEAQDHGYGTPDEWSPEAEKAWGEKAHLIPDWIRERVRHDREATVDGALFLTSLLALSSGAPLPETFLEKARPVVQREAVRRDEWRKEIRKHDPDRNGDLLKLEDWSAEATAAMGLYLAGMQPGAPLPRQHGLLGLMAASGGTSASFDFVHAAIIEAGGPDIPHPWEAGAVNAYARAGGALAKCLFKAAERIVSSEPAWSQDLTIAVQVAASVLMATGTALPEDIRDLAVEAGINGRWHDDAERDRVIDAYLACLRDYRPDEPVVLGMVSLAEAFGRKLAGSEPGGLINRNIPKKPGGSRESDDPEDGPDDPRFG